MLCISTSKQVLRWSKSFVCVLKQVFSSFSVTNEQKRKKKEKKVQKLQEKHACNVSKHEQIAKQIKKEKMTL